MDSNFNLNEILSVLKANLKDWIEVRLKLLQLNIYEKTAIAGSLLILGVIIINLLFFALLFAFFSLGFLLGKWLDSLAGGFALISLFYCLILIIVYIFRKRLYISLQNLFLKELNSEPDEKSQV